MTNNSLDILNKYFGYSSFRKGQENIIKEIISGKDVACIMPTGGGKSICYQIPALMLQSITLVISPLISLMKDQVDSLKLLGIEADYINSSLSNSEIMDIMNRLRNNEIKILYIAPERLDSMDFLNVISNMEVSLVAIDEAHCVSQWGHDFRVSYKKINRFISLLNKRPVVAAFTATATEEVREDIIKLLGLREPKVFITGFNRENLEIEVLKGVNKKSYILDYIEKNKDDSGIIYAATRKECDSLYTVLKDKGYSVGLYHAGLNNEERAKAQEDFVYDKLNIIVATNAFGMGIDKSNVRYVIHYNIPKNIESYYQEIGRAGRDGEPSTCILLFSPSDIHTQKYLIDMSIENPDRKVNEYKKLQTMVDLVYTTSCYKSFILNYFGEESEEDCNNCSNCNLQGELVDKTVDAQKVLSCIYRMKRPYGTTMIVDVLRGSTNKKLKSLGLDEISTYGIVKNYTKDQLKEFINTLVSHRFIDYIEGEFPVLRLNNLSLKVLKGEEKVFLKEVVKVKKSNKNNELYEILRGLRKEISEADRVPPYVVFGDSSLKEMSTRYPTTLEQFLDITGVGESKKEKYGERFVSIICDYVIDKNIEVNWEYKKEGKKSLSTAKDESIIKKESLREEENIDKEKSSDITIKMLKEKPLGEVAKERGLVIGTIFSHVYEYLKKNGTLDFEIDFGELIKEENEEVILKAIDKVGYERLKPIKEVLPDKVSYDEIRAVILKKSCS